MAKPRIQLRRAKPLPLRWVVGMVVGVVALFGLGWWMEDTLKRLFTFDTQSVAVVSNEAAFPDHVHLCILGPATYAWFLPSGQDTAQWPGHTGLPDSLTLHSLQADTLIIIGATGLRLEDLLITANQLTPTLPYQIAALTPAHLQVVARLSLSD